MTQLCRVPTMPRKRRGPREAPLERVNVEVYPDEQETIRRAKADAALRGETFREWLIRAIEQRLELAGGS